MGKSGRQDFFNHGAQVWGVMNHHSPSQQARVLVVEDDPVTAEIASAYLAQSGLDVLRAASGEAALDILRSRHVDWLVTDIKLPGTIDGWVVAAEFHLTHPTRPVLYMTAAAAPSSAQAHGSVFLRKPCHPSLILEQLRRLQANHDPSMERRP